MNKPFKANSFTLFNVVTAATLLLIHGCGGGGDYIGNSSAAGQISLKEPPGLGVGLGEATDCTGAGALPASGRDFLRTSANQIAAPASSLVSTPCASDAGSRVIQ